MCRPAVSPTLSGIMRERPRLADGLFAYDAHMRILLWDDVAEHLTGVSADDAVGRWCRDVLNGVVERGDLARGRGGTAPIGSTRLVIQTENGRRLVTVSTIAAECASEEPIVLELLRTGELVGANGSSASVLLAVPQLEVLRLLAHGVPARLIAMRLDASEATVRNHVQRALHVLHRQTHGDGVAATGRGRTP